MYVFKTKLFNLSLLPAILTLVVFIGADFSHAQLSGPQLQMSLFPKYPVANQSVSISVSGGSVDLNEVDFYWYVDGKLFREGQDRSIEIIAPDLGKTVDVSVRVSSPSGNIESTVTVRPTNIDVIIESESVTPLFYKGKSLLPSEGMVNIYADPYLILPSGERLPPENLTYIWKRNGFNIPGASGKGRNTFSFRVGTLQDSIRPIYLEVYSPQYNIYASTDIYPTIQPSKIIFYQKTPLLGLLLNRSLGNSFEMTGEENTLVALPFFMDGKNSPLGEKLTVTWKINNSGVDYTDESPAMLTIRKPQEPGESIISARITNNSLNIIQDITSRLTVRYGGALQPNF